MLKKIPGARYLALVLILTSTCLLTPVLQAENLRFNGFLTLAGYHGSSNQLGYRTSLSSEHFSKRSQWVFNDLSLVGGQVNYQFNANWQVVAQAVLKDELVRSELDRVKIATLNYRPNSSALLRVGRFYPSNYLVSESRFIGYAHNEVVPTQDFYAQLAFPYIDGIDFTLTQRLNTGLLSLNAYYGQTKVNFDVDNLGELSEKLKNLVGVNFNYEVNNWLLRLSYSQVEQFNEWVIFQQVEDFFNIFSYPQSFPVDNNFTPWIEGLEVLEQNQKKGDVFKYFSFAAEYNHEQLRVRTELAHLESGNYLLPDTNTAYINLAYHSGRVTPFITLSMINSEQGVELKTMPEDAFLDAVDQVYELDSRAILQLVNSFINPAYKQKSVSLGMRWDFADYQAFKFQFEKKWVDKNGAGLWDRDIAVDSVAEQVEVFLISYDWMF